MCCFRNAETSSQDWKPLRRARFRTDKEVTKPLDMIISELSSNSVTCNCGSVLL